MLKSCAKNGVRWTSGIRDIAWCKKLPQNLDLISNAIADNSVKVGASTIDQISNQFIFSLLVATLAKLNNTIQLCNTVRSWSLEVAWVMGPKIPSFQ